MQIGVKFSRYARCGLVLVATMVLPMVTSFVVRPKQNMPVNQNSVSVSIEELEKDLTPEERSVTSVVRKCGPAVAFVTSVMPTRTRDGRRADSRRTDANAKKKNELPNGMGLGSGSGFMVDSGYLCTNFHVIERAYSPQDNSKQVKDVINQLAANATGLLPNDFINASKEQILRKLSPVLDDLPEVYVRVNSDTKYQKCRIVDVEPDLDLAVLKIEEDDEMMGSTSDIVSFGSSSNLIVGQSVVAIGNPFGLDKTVTTGVVSAVNREFRAGSARTPANRPIRNCIQTDAAINPGNSGGPLLNLKGEVVGINTAIITTSGSSAGIGFAVPADQLTLIVDRIIREDRVRSGRRPDRGWLGVTIIDRRQIPSNSTLLLEKNWVTSVGRGSPAAEAGIRPLQLDGAKIKFGDAIVNIGGNDVSSFEELLSELVDRIQGERVSMTLEDENGEKRVVYVTLAERPKNS